MNASTCSVAHASQDGVDLCIAGSGAAGLTAAITASTMGLTVLVIEKSAFIGGTTALSEGMIWVPGSAQAKAAGIADNSQLALRYISAAAGKHFDPERASAYIEHAAQMLEFMEQHSHVRFELVRGSVDYYPHLPGSMLGGRALRPGPFDGRKLGKWFANLRWPLASTMLFKGLLIASADLPHYLSLKRSWRSRAHVARILLRYGIDRLTGWQRGTRLANGNGLVAAMLMTLIDRGVPVATNARLCELHAEGRRIVGVSVEQDGCVYRVPVRSGVVLATGGFSANENMRTEHFSHVREGCSHVRMAPDTNVGDGLLLGKKAGAAWGPNLAQPAAWSPVSLVPQTDGTQVPFPHYIDRGKPGVIAINQQGRRFASEASCYQDFVQSMLQAAPPGGPADVYLIADHQALRSYGLGVVPPAPGRVSPFLSSGYLLKAESVEKLGELLGVPGATLRQTLDEFNESARIGVDPQFARGSDAYQRAAGDPEHKPNPSLRPLEQPPFYAVRLKPGDIATFYGLRTDGHARVLGADLRPIPGLYAAGNDMTSVMGGQYPAAGITVGSAMTFGYVAARSAACRLQEQISSPVNHREN